MVSLDILTKAATHEEFSMCFGIDASKFECKSYNDTLIWRIKSNLPDDVSLMDHLSDIFRVAPIHVKKNSGCAEILQAAYINIGVLYNTVTCSVQVSHECILMLNKHGVGLEIVCYPAEF